MDAVMKVVRSTALPQAMNAVGYVFDAMVLYYPRTTFVGDPATAEWIVLLNGGYLEGDLEVSRG